MKCVCVCFYLGVCICFNGIFSTTWCWKSWGKILSIEHWARNNESHCEKCWSGHFRYLVAKVMLLKKMCLNNELKFYIFFPEFWENIQIVMHFQNHCANKLFTIIKINFRRLLLGQPSVSWKWNTAEC